MKKIYKNILLTLLIISASLDFFGQEKLVNYQHRNNINLKKTERKAAQTPVILPFFDYFNNNNNYPDSSKWADDFAFVNTGFTGYIDNTIIDVNVYNNPPTIGVITLDAIDEKGKVYDHMVYQRPEIADYLTSQPIDLNYLPSDSVYLSFYFQSSNVGNNPETEDSLVLQFFSPSDATWHWIWSTTGTTNKAYKIKNIRIADTIFLKSGFKFRFFNYASIGSNYEPSWLSNCDQWNIDNVYINKNRSASDTIFEDIAMLYPVKSVLKNRLESMPWKHFLASGSSLVNSSLTMIYKHYGYSTTRLTNFLSSFKEVGSGTTTCSTPVEFENANPNKIGFWSRSFDCPFTSANTQKASFEIKSFLDFDDPTEVMLMHNDTSVYYQNFDDYYAYDDGTSEAGYGISGEGALNARVAYKFKNYKRDTLMGIRVFFNRTFENFTYDKFYYLAVWKDNNGVPGDTIATTIGKHPDTLGLNIFQTDSFAIPPVIDSGATFYVGMIQTTNDMLNIGFDRNRNARENLFYNIGGKWQQSAFEGALMIRPWFGKPGNKKSRPVQEENNTATDFNIYPVPAENNITLFCPDEIKNKEQVAIFNSMGTIVDYCSCNESKDIRQLSPGLYFIKTTTTSGNSLIRRFVVSR